MPNTPEGRRRWRAKMKADPERLAANRDYHREYQRRRRATPEGRAQYNAYSSAYQRQRRAAGIVSRQQERKHRLRHLYGMTPETYEQMYADQQGRCAICGREEAVLSVDHKHDGDKRVRELLCHRCTTLLGFAGDSAAVLAAAADYVRKHA